MYDPTWITRDYQKMKVGEMTDRHLYNAIRWIQRTGKRKAWLPRLLLEIDIRRINQQR